MIRLAAFLIFLLPVTASASCFPESHFRFLQKEGAGISEADFKDALNKIESYYAPVVAGRGAKLVINRLWKDATVNSDASQPGNGTYVINSYGGLARFPGMTKLGYLEVACHEMGHHLGGAPKYAGQDWASNEGQADYFATLRCMKALGVSDEDSRAASLVLAKVLAQLGEEPVPSFDKRDPSVVKKTDDEHPAAQCRLDTYAAGVSCQATGELSERDPAVSTCSGGEGSRPRCWFAP